MRSLALLILGAGLLAGCDVDVSSTTTTTEPAPKRLAANETDRFRVCHAATDVFIDDPVGQMDDSRSVDADTVQVALKTPGALGAITAQCDFAGDQVTWRTVDATAAAPHAPETARYALQHRVVWLEQPLADGGRTETSWTDSEPETETSVSFGGSVRTE